MYTNDLFLDTQDHFQQDIGKRKNEVIQAVEELGETTLGKLISYFGYSTYKLTMLGVHFAVVHEPYIDAMSPYDVNAPKDIYDHKVKL